MSGQPVLALVLGKQMKIAQGGPPFADGGCWQGATTCRPITQAFRLTSQQLHRHGLSCFPCHSFDLSTTIVLSARSFVHALFCRHSLKHGNHDRPHSPSHSPPDGHPQHACDGRPRSEPHPGNPLSRLLQLHERCDTYSLGIRQPARLLVPRQLSTFLASPCLYPGDPTTPPRAEIDMSFENHPRAAEEPPT